MEAPVLTVPAIEGAYLVPGEVVDADAVPVRDEETRILRDEQGLPVCEG